MEILKIVTKEELDIIIKNKCVRLEPDGYLNIKTKEVLPVHMSKLFGYLNASDSKNYQIYYDDERKEIIKSIDEEHKLRIYVQTSSKDKRYITFVLNKPYKRYDEMGIIEFILGEYYYTDRNGVSLEEINRKKVLQKKKEEAEKSIRGSINSALKGKKIISFYNKKTKEKMFSLNRYNLSVYYNDIDDIKYVKKHGKLFDERYLSFLEYKLILESLPLNSNVFVWYKGDIFIKAVVRTPLIKKDKTLSLFILNDNNELNKKIQDAENEINIPIVNKSFKFNSIAVEIKDKVINFIYSDKNKVTNIKKNKSISYGNIVSPLCKQYIDDMSIGDTVSIYHNDIKCFTGVITNMLIDGQIHFIINEDFSEKKDKPKKEKKKWQFNDIKMSVNEDKYHFSYKDINKLRTFRISKVIDLGSNVPEEAKIELMKLSKHKKIFINCSGFNCFELRLDHMLTPTRFVVEIVVDNLDKVIKKLNRLNDDKKIQDNNNQVVAKYSIQKSKFYVDSFTKVINKHNIVQGIQLIGSHHNHSTIGHNVKDVVGTFAYYDSKRDQYSTFNIVVHYCEKCRTYFEIRSSFELQLKSVGLKLEDVLTGYYNEHMNPITFKHFGLNERSLLGKYGYSVKRGGPSKFERQLIIDYILENHIMSKAEIKSFLDYLINFNGKKSHMDDAIDKWNQDINYINSLVLQNR